MLNTIFSEKGIIDIIYQYSCGISYRCLENSVRKNFENNNEQVNKNLTDYFYKILSKNIIKNNEMQVSFHLRHISRLVHNQNNIGLRMLFRQKKNHTDSGICNKITNVINDIETKTNIKYKYMFYASK